MKPGATTQSAASIVCLALSSTLPMETIFPAETAMPAWRAGAPVPSTTVPFLISKSYGKMPPWIARALFGSSRWIRVTILDATYLFQHLCVERELRGGDIFLELRHGCRADDRGTQEPAARHIAQRELHQRDASPLGERGVGLHRFRHHRLAETDAEGIEQRETCTGRLHAAQILSR